MFAPQSDLRSSHFSRRFNIALPIPSNTRKTLLPPPTGLIDVTPTRDMQRWLTEDKGRIMRLALELDLGLYITSSSFTYRVDTDQFDITIGASVNFKDYLTFSRFLQRLPAYRASQHWQTPTQIFIRTLRTL